MLKALVDKYHDPIYGRSLEYKFIKPDTGWQRLGCEILMGQSYSTKSESSWSWTEVKAAEQW
jgi:hypothetical protein